MSGFPCRNRSHPGRSVRAVYGILFKRYGPQRWWPGDTRFEIIVGAILTQNTAWTNVEKAIASLKDAGALASPAAMHRLPARSLARLIRPAGYYNVKAGRLKNFLRVLACDHGLSLRALARLGTEEMRHWLLAVNGIGPETADSILLYAFGRPVFVVDAYTKRIFSRCGLCGADAAYHDVQVIFTEWLPGDAPLFNEYHALIVRLGKEACRTRPKCALCPVGEPKSLANRRGRYYNRGEKINVAGALQIRGRWRMVGKRAMRKAGKAGKAKTGAGKAVKRVKAGKPVTKKRAALKIKTKKAPAKAGLESVLEKIGVVTHYFPHVNAAAIKLQKSGLRVGDQIYIKGHTTDFKENVESIQLDHAAIPEGKKGQEIGLLVKSRVRMGDSVYKV